MSKHVCEDPRCYVCGAPAKEERVLVDVRTAMRMCRVSRATLYRWMRDSLVDWVKLPYGTRRLYLDSLFREPPRPQDAIP
jgi:hypothetical protein